MSTEAARRLLKEFKDLKKSLPEGFSASPADDGDLFKHPPVNDEYGYEDISERWTPAQTVETIIISVISMLSCPNDESPANIDAAKELRENKKVYDRKLRRIAEMTQEGTAELITPEMPVGPAVPAIPETPEETQEPETGETEMTEVIEVTEVAEVAEVTGAIEVTEMTQKKPDTPVKRMQRKKNKRRQKRERRKRHQRRKRRQKH
ncbi:hypothetical protein BGZ65_009086 [Modicella reniformis]|uniref:UBC core domain-containing protein n=1 Tax=Modicella reniformis TaxID=1440133 RepID=A0A9P6MAP7_9FUNG|nr:hypothetical protein BGZ65_009086 [Modicella reniformis]